MILVNLKGEEIVVTLSFTLFTLSSSSLNNDLSTKRPSTYYCEKRIASITRLKQFNPS